MNASPRPDRPKATLHLPDELDVVLFEVRSGRLTAEEQATVERYLSERFDLPVLVTQGTEITIERYI